MSDIQLTGSLTINSVDVAAYVSSFVIKRERTSVSVPATLGNLREVEKAGALREAIEIRFFSSLAATSLWAELYDAIDTDTAELTFSGRLEDGDVGSDNPEFSGTMVVLGVDTGADVASLREQSQTYPITADGVTKAIS
jgi:hypothetical protein